MNFESCLRYLKLKLNEIHPTRNVKTELGDEERQVEILRNIQTIITKIMKKITQGTSPVIETTSLHWKTFSSDKKMKKRRLIDFKKKNQRQEFTTIVFLLSKIYKLLHSQQTITRREIYYENLKMFKTQTEVDRGMKEVCSLLNTQPWECKVLATSKGLVSGPVVLQMKNGELIDCRKHGGVSIPQNVLEIESMSSSAEWVLVVEKDTCFQRLVNGNKNGNRLGSCIVLTGKGFPDVNSRILVCKFWEFLQIPILVLVDADPHGFEIMCVYRFGSLSMSACATNLACPAIRWIGIHPTDIQPLLLNSKPLTKNDVRKVQLMLQRCYIKQCESLKSQLETLLNGKVKAEMESVASISTNYLTDVYLKHKIQCQEFF